MKRKITLSHMKTGRKIWLRNAVHNMGENRAKGRRRIRDRGRRWGGGGLTKGDERRLEGKKRKR